MPLTTDIAILGAGPAGAAAALRLSYLGIRCTLIDRASFPRDKVCGDALSGKVTTLLNRLDPAIMERFYAQYQPTDVWGIRFYPPSLRHIELPFQWRYEREPAAAPGYVSTRMDFDHFLVQEVQRRPDIDFRPDTNVAQYERTERGWRISDAQGHFVCDCRLLLVADGAHSGFARRVAGLGVEPPHYAAAVRAYYRGVTGFHAHNFIELHFLKELVPGYFWVFPLPNGMANVGLGMRSDYVRKRRLNLRRLLPEIIEQNPHLRERFAGAERVDAIQGYGLPLGSKKRVLSGDHYLLLGDAGHLIDPLTGEGIGNGMYSGFIAAELAERCLAENRFDADWLRAYDVRVDRVLGTELRFSYRLQRVMSQVWLTNLLTGIIADNPRVVELLCRMYTDLELRKQLLNPLFWLRLPLRVAR